MTASIIALFMAVVTTIITVVKVTRDYRPRKGSSNRQYTHLLPNTCYTSRMVSMWMCGTLWAYGSVGIVQKTCPEGVDKLVITGVVMSVLCFFGILHIDRKFRRKRSCAICGAPKGYPCDPAKHCEEIEE